jgi:hypothetical protein
MHGEKLTDAVRLPDVSACSLSPMDSASISNQMDDAWQDATKAKPSFAAAYTNMGTIYQGRKQNEKAR